jgi:hypothetical protein
MRNRRKLSIVGAAALFLGLSFTALHAAADTSADKKEPPKDSGGKGKAGDACKTNADCDQSGRPQRCRESKCELAPVHPVT